MNCTSHWKFCGTCFKLCILMLENHLLATHSLIYQTNNTFIVSRIVDLKFGKTHPTNFLCVPYKLLPPIKSILMHKSHFSFFVSFHFHHTIFHGLAGACMNPSLESDDGGRVGRWVGGFSNLETWPSCLLNSE